MAWGHPFLRLFATLLLLGMPLAAAGAGGPPGEARRIVSMNPSLTAILVALGAEESLVGVDDFSAREQPSLASLPRVGGLYNPSLEGVVGLQPDLVVLVPSVEQRDLVTRLAELAIPVLALNPLSFEQVLESILTLGERVGRSQAARHRVEAIRSVRRAVQEAARKRSRPKVVLILQRDPLFVVGQGSFLDEMLEFAGAENLGRQLADPYPRASLEWLIASAPEVLLDASRSGEVLPGEYWSRWPSLPAVRDGRVVALTPQLATLPGPYLDRGLRALALAVHGVPLPGASGP